MKVLSVVGARPQFVKLAPVHKALHTAGHSHVIIHTGQHYDHAMSDVFFRDFEIPLPDENLSIGSASHGRQTGLMLEGLELAMQRHQPDWVLAYGDTNSTLAAAIAAVKIHQRLAHLEAGLRSFNRLMPEEHNRVLTDHASDLLLAPTISALENLRNEGLGPRSHVVGDVMTDVCFQTRDAVSRRPALMPEGWSSDGTFVIATIHRQENTDAPSRLREIVAYLASSELEVRLIVHPRLAARAEADGLRLDNGKVKLFSPLSYPQLISALLGAAGVITDSGGLQKEAFLLRVPCITIRTETEWVETVSTGWNVLMPKCNEPIDDILSRSRSTNSEMPFGDGHAANRVVQLLDETLI